MQPTDIARVLKLYGLAATTVLPVQKGYRNASYPVRLPDGVFANVILYKNEAGMEETVRRIHAVARYLAGCGLSVRYPLDHRIVRAKSSRGERYIGVYNYLAGYTLSWEAYTQKHMKLLGKTLSDLHAALENYPIVGIPLVADQYQVIYRRMRTYFADRRTADALAAKLQLHVPPQRLEKAQRLLLECGTLSGQQVLHMDFVRSNILFSDGQDGIRLSGIIDFEKMAVGHPLFDIARTLAFLLVDCKYEESNKIRKYFLYSGYVKRGAKRLQIIRLHQHLHTSMLLEELLNIFWLYDFYKFLRHTPYESLCANDHFMRTRDILLERGVISTTYMV